MNTSSPTASAAAEQQFGRRLAALLEAASLELPHDSAERLRVARTQALARRRVVQLSTAPAIFSSGSTAILGGGWWTRLAGAVPLLALAVALLVLNIVQADNRAAEVAEVDAALLTDELPPAAYTDPGFVQFLKSDEAASR